MQSVAQSGECAIGDVTTNGEWVSGDARTGEASCAPGKQGSACVVMCYIGRVHFFSSQLAEGHLLIEDLRARHEAQGHGPVGQGKRDTLTLPHHTIEGATRHEGALDLARQWRRYVSFADDAHADARIVLKGQPTTRAGTSDR